MPKSSKPFHPLLNPAIFVDPARSAEHTIASGLLYFLNTYELIHEPKSPKAARFGAICPGSLNKDLG